MINDRESLVTVVLDACYMEHEQVNFHPMVSHESVGLHPRALLSYLRSTGHEPLVVDFAGAERE